MIYHDPLSVALEIREQLASEKRMLAFFTGAGTSMAVGFPGISDLTSSISETLEDPLKKKYNLIKEELQEQANVEAILDRIRIYCELIGDDKEKTYSGLVGQEARDLDREVCNAICGLFCNDPPKGLNPHLVFAQWLGALRYSRDWPVEIFTINYDLLFEKAMEAYGIPFFDGFLGSVNPFFIPESVEAEKWKRFDPVCPPKGWTRLWKIHGSINWRRRKYMDEKMYRIVRVSGERINKGDDLVIFPSREKYQQSRKLPYVAFQDRLRRVISSGECLLVVIGYSFSDEHLNEIIIQGLRSNPQLAVMALIYGDISKESKPPHYVVSDYVLNLGKEYRNLTIYGPDRACIGGIVGTWSEPNRKQEDSEVWPFWNEDNKSFTLGDFNAFADFLEKYIGFQPIRRTTEEGILSPQETETLEMEDTTEK